MRKYFASIILLALCITSFSQVTEKQGWVVKGYNESMAKKYLDNSSYLDDIEGIWLSSDGYKYAIEKEIRDGVRQTDEFRMIVLASGSNGWSPTEVKGFLSTSSVERVYSLKYYTRDAQRTILSSENLLLLLENPLLASFQRANGVIISLLKLYPKVDGATISAPGQNSGSQSLERWSGSSIVIGSKYLATNYHVVDGAQSLVVSGIGGTMSIDYDAEVLCVDKNNDLAIIKITDSRFNGFRVPKYGFKTKTVDVGTEVFVLGYPLITEMGNEVKLTTGVVSAKSGYQGDVSLYQVSAPIQPGNSGGPLFDNDGNLIGIVNAVLKGAENVGYAIKLSYLKNLIESSGEDIEFSFSNTITSLKLTDKIKQISPYVLMVKANTKVGSTGSTSVGGGTNQNSVASSAKAEASRLYQAALENYKGGDYDTAFTSIEQSISLFPTPEAHFLRGALAGRLSNYDVLEESYLYCIEKGYKIADCYYDLAVSFAMRGLPNQAISYCDLAIGQDRTYVQAYHLKGNSLIQKGDKVEGRQVLEKATQYVGIAKMSDVEWSDLYNSIAYTYLEDEQLEKALENIQYALSHDRTNGNLWDTFGAILYKKNDWEGCVNSTNKAIVLAKRGTEHWLDESYYYRGMSKIMLKYTADGYNDLKKAFDLGSEQARAALSHGNWDDLDYSKTMSFLKVISIPYVEKHPASDIKIESIEITNEFTAIYFSYTNTDYPTGGWYSIDKDCYILDKKTKEKLILFRADNCAISPQTSSIAINQTAKFVLYFAPVSKDCKEIDLIENSESGWKFYGIRLNNTKKTSNDRFSDGLYQNEAPITENDVRVVYDRAFTEGLIYVETITKTSGWGNAASNLGQKNATEMCKKEAVKKKCTLILITNVDKGYTTSVTAELYKQP